MTMQALIPGSDYLNSPGTGLQYLIPGYSYLNDGIPAGTATAAAVKDIGRQITVTFANMTASGISGFQSGKTATVACVSEGYHGTTLGTRNRQIAARFTSAAQSGADAIVTLDLGTAATPVLLHDDDVATVTIDAGAFSDGSVSSLVVSALSLTNGSTRDYPKVIGNIAGVIDEAGEVLLDREVFTGPITVEAMGVNFYENTEDAEALEAVKFTLTDGSGNAIVQTASVMSPSLYHDYYVAAVGKTLGVYSSGALDPASATPSALVPGPVTVSVDLVPFIGDANSIRTMTWTMFYDDGSGHIVNAAPVYVDTNPGLGNDSNDGSVNAPYATLRKALDATKGTTTLTKFTIRLKPLLDPVLTPYIWVIPASGSSNNEIAVTIEAYGGSEANTYVRGSTGARVRFTVFKHITLDTSDGTATGNTQLLGYSGFTDDFAAFKNCIVTHPFGRDSTASSVAWYATFHVNSMLFNTIVSDLTQRCIQNNRWSRNVEVLKSTEDLIRDPGFMMAVLGSDTIDTSDDHSQHCDGIQYALTGDQNSLIYCAKLLKLGSWFTGGAGAQGFFAGTAVSNIALVNCIIQQWGDASFATAAQLGHANNPAVSHILLRNVTVPNQRVSLTNTGADSFGLIQITNCVFGRWLGGATKTFVEFNGNNFVIEDNNGGDTLPAGWTAGDALFRNGVAGLDTFNEALNDYHPLATSPLIGLTTRRTHSYDLEGNAIPNDATAAIGALQFTIPVPEDLELSQVAGGTGGKRKKGRKYPSYIWQGDSKPKPRRPSPMQRVDTAMRAAQQALDSVSSAVDASLRAVDRMHVSAIEKAAARVDAKLNEKRLRALQTNLAALEKQAGKDDLSDKEALSLEADLNELESSIMSVGA